jgi:hypothetical protein
MGKNRRKVRFKHPLTYVPKPVGIGFIVFVSLALAYLWMGHKCSQYSEEIKRLEDKYAELENERVREETKWNGMKTAEQLDQLLVRNGLLMVYPTAGQIVRISGSTSRSSPATTALAQVPPGGTVTPVAMTTVTPAHTPAPTPATRPGATRVAGGRPTR